MNPPSLEFRTRVRTIHEAKVDKRIKDMYFDFAICLEYNLLTQVEEILWRKRQLLIKEYMPVIFDDEKRRSHLVGLIIKLWHLT